MLRRTGIAALASARFALPILFVGSALLPGCAQLPSPSSVQAFGQAASSASTIFSSSVDLNNDLAQRSGENSAVLKFLAKCSATDADCRYQLPTQDDAHLAKDALQPRSDLIAAIGKYANSLATASDPKTIQDLQSAATSLASTVGGDLAPIIGPVGTPLIGPASQIFGSLVGAAVTEEEASQILEIMKRTHPLLVQAASDLKDSFAVIKRNNETQLKRWRNSQIAVLTAVRDDKLVPSNVAEAEFRSAAADARTLQAKITAMGAYSKTLDAMVKAHAALIDPKPDSNADLAQFLAMVGQLQAVVSVIKH